MTAGSVHLVPVGAAGASLQNLQERVGRTATVKNVNHGSLAHSLFGELDRAGESLVASPLLWHWLYYLTSAPRASIGADGHPWRGGFLPPVPLPRRMWADGSRESALHGSRIVPVTGDPDVTAISFSSRSRT